MPIDWSTYPQNWPTFRQQILTRAAEQCECTGQCDNHPPNPALRRCSERQHKKARWFKGTVRLTIAHLCSCFPLCTDDTHCIAACQICHLRIDRFAHAAARMETQRKKHWPSLLPREKLQP
jgi:hypothetical protein